MGRDCDDLLRVSELPWYAASILDATELFREGLKIWLTLSRADRDVVILSLPVFICIETLSSWYSVVGMRLVTVFSRRSPCWSSEHCNLSMTTQLIAPSLKCMVPIPVDMELSDPTNDSGRISTVEYVLSIRWCMPSNTFGICRTHRVKKKMVFCYTISQLGSQHSHSKRYMVTSSSHRGAVLLVYLQPLFRYTNFCAPSTVFLVRSCHFNAHDVSANLRASWDSSGTLGYYPRFWWTLPIWLHSYPHSNNTAIWALLWRILRRHSPLWTLVTLAQISAYICSNQSAATWLATASIKMFDGK